MNEEVLVPSVGESITQGVLSAWLKQEGEWVEEGEDLFELETDKASVAVPSPAEGVVHIQVPAGQNVEIGQVVGSVEVGARKAGARKAEPAPQGAEPPPAEPEAPGAAAAPAPAAAAPAAAGGGGEEPLPGGRRVPMSPLRKTIAARLLQARQGTALLTTFNEINMERVMALRKAQGESFEKAHGVRLGFMSFFVKACCQALKDFPEVNAWIEGEEIVYHDRYDIGVAVSTERGLLVPILRGADALGFGEIEKRILDLARRARDKRITPDELAGGTFTITNGGVFGSLLSTPLPNYPQSAILGMHAIQERPVAVDGQVVIKPMMYVALSYDHRLIDGREAVQFLVRVKEIVEDPQLLLLHP